MCVYVDERIADSSRFASSKSSVGSDVDADGDGGGGAASDPPASAPDDDPDDPDAPDDPDDPDDEEDVDEGDGEVGDGEEGEGDDAFGPSTGRSAPFVVLVVGSPSISPVCPMHPCAPSATAANTTSSAARLSFDMGALFAPRLPTSNTHPARSAHEKRTHVREIRMELREMRSWKCGELVIE